MSLISREMAIEALEFERDCLETPERINGVEDAIEIIQQLPSINAVPLDKLCEMLSKSNVNVPCNDDCEGCEAFDGTGDTVNCWKVTLTKWMGGN